VYKMANYFIGGVMTADLFVGDQLFSTAKTLLDSSITISVDSADVTGGTGNKLFGKYFHTSKFDMKFTDAMFKLEYIAKNIGSDITVGGDALITESVVLGAGGAGTVLGTPASFGTYGAIGWVARPNTDTWTKVTFTGKDFTFSGGVEDETVCVRFMQTDSGARKLVVSSDIIPDTVKVIGRVGLFAGDSFSTASKVGTVQIQVDRLQLAGSVELSMTSNGVSNTPLSGSALSVDSATCEGGGYYAIITELIDGRNWYDDVNQLSISGGSVDLAVAGTETLEVYALHQNALPSKVDNSQLTFTTEDATKVTVGANTGLVTGVATTTGTTVTVSITAKPNVKAFVDVVVS
jgi:hypothetical protein